VHDARGEFDAGAAHDATVGDLGGCEVAAIDVETDGAVVGRLSEGESH
jgi:hypothetical protein